MNKSFYFFIDESGAASPKNTNSPLYILCGIMINQTQRNELAIKADHIKFKYFDTTNIIFHSKEMSRAEGDFRKLKDNTLAQQFHKDIIRFLKNGNYQLFGIVVDKSKIPKNWNEKTIYKMTADAIVSNFILALLAQPNCHGKLVIESATAEKDFYYHKSATRYLSLGFPMFNIQHQEVQNKLTKISFVTKRNNDIEEQIADLLAYGLRLKYEKRKQLTTYETKLLEVINQKLFVISPSTGSKKKRYYSKIKSYNVIP